MSNKIKQFLAARDAALLSLDEKRIRAFGQKYNVPMSNEPEVFWRSVHKSRTALPGLPMEARTLSKRWLIAHNSEPFDDGDVPL